MCIWIRLVNFSFLFWLATGLPVCILINIEKNVKNTRIFENSDDHLIKLCCLISLAYIDLCNALELIWLSHSKSCQFSMDVWCFYLLGQLLHSCGLQALCQGQEQLLYIYPSKLHDYDQFLKWHIIEFFNFKKLIKLKTLVYYCHWFRNGSTKINFTSWKSPSYKRVVVPFMWKIIKWI